MRPQWPTLTILGIALWLFTTTGGGYPLLVVSFVVFLRRGGMMRWHMPPHYNQAGGHFDLRQHFNDYLVAEEVLTRTTGHRLAMAGIASFGVEQLHPDH